jgi:hypothetical protein
MASIAGGVVGFLIGLVVVAAIAVVTYSVTKEMSKPATESNGQRREPGRSSRLKPMATAAVAASKGGGRTVVDSGRQIGRNLAELAKSSVAMPAAPVKPQTPPSPNGAGGTTAAPATRSHPVRTAAADAPARPSTRESARTGATRVATAARTVIRSVPGAVEPSEEYEFIVPSVPRRARQRLYPRWWRRIFSFVVLGLLTLAFGIAVGAAIGALLAFANRAIQGSL